MLYYIFILHQTTTGKLQERISQCCIISSFYIKPQLVESALRLRRSCIISSFYIKPQPMLCLNVLIIVVLYLHSTSNHNLITHVINIAYVVLYLHSTSNHNISVRVILYRLVVLYLHSTSNHNLTQMVAYPYTLYYIFILHQTTTGDY